MGGGKLCQLIPRRPYIPHPLPLCCNYPVLECPSGSVVVTSNALRYVSSFLVVGGDDKCLGEHASRLRPSHYQTREQSQQQTLGEAQKEGGITTTNTAVNLDT